MSTDAQIRANQANALLSAGPRTEEGKARTRLNSQTHGLRSKTVLLPGEDSDELAALEASLYEECKPVGPQEEFCIGQMVQNQWRLRRISRLEAEAFAAGTPDQKQLSLLIRYEGSLTRAYYKASKELRELQKARAAAETAAAKAEDAAETESLGRPASLLYLRAHAPPARFAQAFSRRCGGIGFARRSGCQPQICLWHQSPIRAIIKKITSLPGSHLRPGERLELWPQEPHWNRF